MKTYPCPHCKTVAPAMNFDPKPGSVGICSTCGGFTKCDENQTLVKLGDADFRKLSMGVQQQMIRLRTEWQRSRTTKIHAADYLDNIFQHVSKYEETVTEMNGLECLHCHFKAKIAVGVDNDRPVPGAYSICHNCGGITRFTDSLGLELFDISKLPKDEREELEEASKRLLERRVKRGPVGGWS